MIQVVNRNVRKFRVLKGAWAPRWYHQIPQSRWWNSPTNQKRANRLASAKCVIQVRCKLERAEPDISRYAPSQVDGKWIDWKELNRFCFAFRASTLIKEFNFNSPRRHQAPGRNRKVAQIQKKYCGVTRFFFCYQHSTIAFVVVSNRILPGGAKRKPQLGHFMVSNSVARL